MRSDTIPEFNLIYEPWIAVRAADGSSKEISLLELFKGSVQYQSLAGEIPAQNAAVLRLLLAILHGALEGKDIEGEPFSDDSEEQIDDALDLWANIWQSGFPYSRIEAYLTKYKERFYLFHPTTPFYQLAELEKRDDAFGPFNISKLIGDLAESDNKKRLFAARSGEGKDSISYSEATRWLLYYISYAETFGKIEAKGKKGKQDPSVGVGWLGKLGVVFALGNNLFETLMLNLVLFNRDEEPWGDGKAVWEKPVNNAERNAISLPDSQAELLTLQSRRILLKRNNGRVDAFKFISGDFCSSEEAFSEMMTVWKYTKLPGEKVEHYRPKTFQPSVQVWRDFASLMAQNDAERRRIPGVVWWLKYLIGKKRLPAASFIKFYTVGVVYGNMQAFVTDEFSDSLSFNAALLSEFNHYWITVIIDELSTTDKLVKEVGALAQNIAKASGVKDGNAEWNHGASAREDAKMTAYYMLDPYFRSWLESIDPAADEIDGKINEWWETAKAIIRTLGSELISNCSPQALIGRSGISAIDSYNWFIYNTHKRESLKQREVIKHGKAASYD